MRKQQSRSGLHWGRSLSAVLGALFVLGLAGPLQAASIQSVTAVLGAGHSADVFGDALPDLAERTSTLDVVSNDANAFLTRFAATLSSDAEAGGSNQNLTLDVDYAVTVSIDALVGETWDLAIDHSRYGALTLVDDDSGRAQASARAVTVTVSGATLTSGALDLAATGNLNGGAGGYLDIAQLTSGVLSGTGPQLVTLQFDFQLRTHTIAQGGAGDEASVRLGIASALDPPLNFIAGSYPGVGLRTLGSDGHFVAARLVTPEPGTFLSVSLGLLGLAVLGRSRSQSSSLPRLAHRRR